MKKLFYPLCPQCLKLEGTDITNIRKGRITIVCPHCGYKGTDHWKNVKGKFSWKIDLAVKWNIFKMDFEPYSKAYLDPDMGSYFIARKLSEAFFGGYFSESVNYGQILMDKSLSYKILPSFPLEVLNAFFVQNRKKDMELSERKMIQYAHDYMVEPNMSFYDYVIIKLPYEIFESAQGSKIPGGHERFYTNGIAFAKHFLNRDLTPQLPTKELLKDVDTHYLSKIQKLIHWVISYRLENFQITTQDFLQEFMVFLRENKIYKGELFPIIRKLLSQEHSVPMHKIFYYSSLSYLSGCLLVIMHESAAMKKKRLSTIKNIDTGISISK